MAFEEIEPVSAVRKKPRLWPSLPPLVTQTLTHSLAASFEREGKIVNENLFRVRQEHDQASSLQDRKLQVLRKNYLHWCTSCLLQPSSLLPALSLRSWKLFLPCTNLG